MTLRQLRKAQAKRRNEKRKAKAAPKKSLKEWANDVKEDGVCDACGIGIVQLLNKDGTPRLSKHKDPKKRKPVYSQLHAHHILPKERYPQFRTLRINGVCFCASHHKFSRWSAHRNPLWFVLWLKKNRPEQYEWAKAHLGVDPTVRK